MAEAKAIQASITTFFGTALHLTCSADKTLITPATTGRASLLGSAIGMMAGHTKFDHLHRRVLNGHVGMYIPEDVMQATRQRDMRDGQPLHRPALLNDSAYAIIHRYQGQYRGLVKYYALARN
jgi:hypothetical protein